MSRAGAIFQKRLTAAVAEALARGMQEFKYVHVSTENPEKNQVIVHFDLGVLRNSSPRQVLSLFFMSNLNAIRRSIHWRLDRYYNISYKGSSGHGFAYQDVDNVPSGDTFNVRFSFQIRSLR